MVLLVDGRGPDRCGFYDVPSLSPLVFASGEPVMRGDVELMYHRTACRFVHGPAEAPFLVTVPAFDPAAWSDGEIALMARAGDERFTDLASIPGLARAVYPPNGRYLRPALKHDAAYASHGFGDQIDRALADRRLLEDMKAVGCGWVERQTIYGAVRVGGGGGWGR